jgi:hypothetical protein
MKKILVILSILTVVIGILMIGGGAAGLALTYVHVARENITTTDDASIPSTPVRGPFTLKAQADIIREHVLHSTGGKTFAEMPGRIPQVDEDGKQVLGEDGKPVMVANEARNIWITATTLTTALNLAIISYALSGLVLFLGLVFFMIGIILDTLNRK